MRHDPEHLIAIAEAQHKAYKRATRRLQRRRRLERTTEANPVHWIAAVRRDDATDAVLVTANRSQL